MRKMKKLFTQVISMLCLLCITTSALAGTLSLPAGLKEIEEEAFEGTAATSVVISNSTERISSRAFVNSMLTDVYLPANNIDIAEDAFDSQEGLTFHVFMGSANANWVLDRASDRGWQVVYATSDEADLSSGGWNTVNELIATETTDTESFSPYYTKRLIVRLKSGYSLPDLTSFDYKEIVPLDNNRYVIQFGDSEKTENCAIALQGWNGCQHVEKDYFLSFSETENTATPRSSSLNMTDPMGFGVYTSYLGNGVGHVTIAVIDNGVNASQVGCPVSDKSFDFATNSKRTSGYPSHGTNVANQIADAFGSLADEHLTIIGYNIKVNGEISYLYMVEAIDRAKTDGADFINISIAGASTLSDEQQNLELQAAINDYGKGRIIAAAGNHAESASRYLPGKYCVSAGAVQFNNSGILRRADQTCTGATYSGYAPNTSYASAKVTAAMALVSLDPNHAAFALWGDEDEEIILENGALMPKLDDLAITKVTEIVLNDGDPIESILEVGDRASIDFEVLPSTATDKTVTVTSSNENIIEIISQTGTRVRISAKAQGTANLTFASNDGNVSVVATITVIQPVISVTLSGDTEETLYQGQTLALTATVLPDNATDKTLIWTSSDHTKATVSETGVVTPVAGGDGPVTITATSRSNPSVSDAIQLTVSPLYRPDHVIVTAPKSTIGIGNSAETLQFTATVYPAGTDQTVRWSIDHNEIATIDENGLLTPRSAGQVIVTATSVVNGANGFKGITIIQLPTSISISGANTVNVGETVQLTANVLPTNAADKSVTWESSKPTIATVNSSGVVTGVAEGSAVILAKSNADHAVVGYYAINVEVLPISVTVSPSSAIMDINGTLALTGTVNPSNATNKTLTWSTNDSSIATVNSNGVVTAKAAGSVTITAKTINNKTGSATITVRQPYTLSYNANGGSVSPTSRTCYSGYAIGGTLPTPTKDYCDFLGWFTAASGGTQVTTSTSFTSASTVTIYAHWQDHGWSDWVTPGEVPSNARTVATKTQYRYRDQYTSYSDWSAWGDWQYSAKTITDSNLMQEEKATRIWWWAAKCTSCGRHNPYHGSSTKCKKCGRYLKNDQGLWTSARYCTETKGTTQTIDGRSEGRYFDGLPYWGPESRAAYRYRTRTVSYPWGSWSGWSDTAVSATSTREVETRTMVRYQLK